MSQVIETNPTDYSLVSALNINEHSSTCLTILPHFVIFRISTSCTVFLLKIKYNSPRESLVLQSPPWLLRLESSARYGINKVSMQTTIGSL